MGPATPLSQEVATQIVQAFAKLPYYASEPIGDMLLADELVAMCGTTDRAMWTIRRAFQLWSKWEGFRELRAIYCSRWKPCDGIEAGSSLYLDGVPADPTVAQLLAPDGPPIPAQIAAWEKECGPPDPEWSRRLLERADEQIKRLSAGAKT